LHLYIGDSNNPNPPTGGLGYGKSENPGLNLTAMGHLRGIKKTQQVVSLKQIITN
jgi:hypothetical protein